MIIIKSIIFAFVLVCISYVEGSLLWYYLARMTKIRITKDINLGITLYSGYVLLGCISALVTGIGVLIGLEAFVGAFVLALIIIASIIMLTILVIRSKGEVLIKEHLNIRKMRPAAVLLYVVAFIIFIVQVIVVIGYQYNSFVIIQDIPIATRVYDTGMMVKGSLAMNTWGIVSLAMNIHPMLLLFTSLPVPLIGLYYIGYHEVIKIMSNEDNNSHYSIIGLIAIELLGIWGYQSDVLMNVTILSAWYTGGAFVVHALLPCVLIMVLTIRPAMVRTTEKQSDIEALEEDEDYQEEWDMKKHKIVNARNLAIALGLVSVLLIACVYILNNKINTLHDATANLQRDLSERCKIYEFTNSVGEVEGYLIKGSDNKLTMIGGGEEANAEDLYDFLSDYGYEIKDWYLYDKDIDNIGAFAKCINEKDVEVENVYFLNRVDVEDLNK